MKSGFFGSRPSAIQPTVTPLPVASWCAWGRRASVNSVWVVCSASGSSSGLVGSLGQLPGSTRSGPAAGPACALIVSMSFLPSGCGRVSRSGATAATFGSACIWATWAGDMLAANPLITEYCLTPVAPPARALLVSGACSLCVVERRWAAADLAGSSVCWLRSTTMTVLRSPAAGGLPGAAPAAVALAMTSPPRARAMSGTWILRLNFTVAPLVARSRRGSPDALAGTRPHSSAWQVIDRLSRCQEPPPLALETKGSRIGLGTRPGACLEQRGRQALGRVRAPVPGSRRPDTTAPPRREGSRWHRRSLSRRDPRRHSPTRRNRRSGEDPGEPVGGCRPGQKGGRPPTGEGGRPLLGQTTLG